MNKKQILDRAYMAKVGTKSEMRAVINKNTKDIDTAENLIKVVDAALDYNYECFRQELEDAYKEAEA